MLTWRGTGREGRVQADLAGGLFAVQTAPACSSRRMIVGQVKERKTSGRASSSAPSVLPPLAGGTEAPFLGRKPKASYEENGKVAKGNASESGGKAGHGTRADLARKLKALTEGTARLVPRVPLKADNLDQGEGQPTTRDDVLCGLARKEEGVVDEFDEEGNEGSGGEGEDWSWARRVWVGRFGIGVEKAKGGVLSSPAGSETVFCRGMLSSDAWTRAECLTLRDVGLLCRSSVASQRSLAFDLLRRSFEHSSVAAEDDAEALHAEAYGYLRDACGLHSALARDCVSTNPSLAQPALGLAAELLLPALWANHLAQRRTFCPGLPRSGPFREGLAKDLAAASASLGDVLASGRSGRRVGLGEQAALSAFRIAAALGESSEPPGAALLEMAASRLGGDGPPALRAHAAWALASSPSSPPSEALLCSASSVYSSCRARAEEGFPSHAERGFLLDLLLGRFHLPGGRLHGDPSSEALRGVLAGLKEALAVDKPLRGDLVSAASVLRALLSFSTSSSSWRGLGAGLVNELLAKVWSFEGDDGCYALAALAAGLDFLSRLAAEGALEAAGLSRLASSRLPALQKGATELLSSLIRQSARGGRLREGEDLSVGLAATTLLHSTWHGACASFLIALVGCAEAGGVEDGPEWARRVALGVLSAHRSSREFVVVGDAAAAAGEETQRSLISRETAAAHGALMARCVGSWRAGGADVPWEEEPALVAWDCAAEAIFQQSAKAKAVVRADTLFDRRDLEAVLGGVGSLEDDPRPAVDPAEMAAHLNETLDAAGMEGGADGRAVDWMFSAEICEGRPDLYPPLALYLTRLERLGSRYLLGLPVELKLTKVLVEAFCHKDDLFKEPNFAEVMPVVVGAHAEALARVLARPGSSDRRLRLPTSIVDQFASVSLGDPFFARCASLAFSSAQQPAAQVEAWKAACASDCFALFPDVTSYDATQRSLFFELPVCAPIARACFESLLSSGSLRRQVERGASMAGCFAAHCVTEHLFGGGGEVVVVKREEEGPSRRAMAHKAVAFLEESTLEGLLRYAPPPREGAPPALETHPRRERVEALASILGEGGRDLLPLGLLRQLENTTVH